MATATRARTGALEAIGKTPIVRLAQLPAAESAEVWVKLEAANPTGSYKDRMALAMIEGGERSGRLQPGQTVVEYTGGSTGSSLASRLRAQGLSAPNRHLGRVRRREDSTMEAFGAQVEVLPSPAGITPDLVPRMMGRAAEIVAETDGFATDQFNNTDMVEGYRALGREILDQLDGPPDAFCGYIGTAGCFVGVTRELRASAPAVHRVAIEPAESPVLSEGRTGTHHIEGGGAGFWPPLLERDDMDEIMAVSDAQAFETARRAAREEGVFSGPSSGASPALTVAKRLGLEPRRDHVDPGLKYLVGRLYAF